MAVLGFCCGMWAFLAVAHRLNYHVWDLVPRPGVKPDLFALGVWSFIHWTTRKTPRSVQFRSVARFCPTLCYPMDCSVPGLPVHHQLLEFTHTRVHWVGGAIQPSHPLSSPSPPTFNLSQHQGLFKQVSSLHPSIGVSALASVLPMNTQDWFLLEWAVWSSKICN